MDAAVIPIRQAHGHDAVAASVRAQRQLRRFLRTHVAALHAGVCVIQRTLKAERDEPMGRELAPIHLSLREDLLLLEIVGQALGVRSAGRVRNLAARTKGRISWRRMEAVLGSPGAPLSRICELEQLIMLAERRATLWRILERHARVQPALDVVDHGRRAIIAERERALLVREVIDASFDAF